MSGMNLGRGDIDLEMVAFGGNKRIVQVQLELVLREAPFAFIIFVEPVEVDDHLGYLDFCGARVELPGILQIVQEDVCELEVVNYDVLDAYWEGQLDHGWGQRERDG